MNPELWLREATRSSEPLPPEHDDPVAARAHVLDVLSELSTMMMVTHDRTNPTTLHARPMSVAKIDPDGTIYFLTDLVSHKVEEVRASTIGLCTGQTKTRYASVRGTFTVSNDRALVARVWSKAADAWFPQGKDDPAARVLVFRPIEAEVWDLSGTRGISYLASLVTSALTGDPPVPKEGTHDKVSV